MFHTNWRERSQGLGGLRIQQLPNAILHVNLL